MNRMMYICKEYHKWAIFEEMDSTGYQQLYRWFFGMSDDEKDKAFDNYKTPSLAMDVAHLGRLFKYVFEEISDESPYEFHWHCDTSRCYFGVPVMVVLDVKEKNTDKVLSAIEVSKGNEAEKLLAALGAATS